MNTTGKIAIRESKMKIKAANLIRWSGLAAMAGGIIFAGIQPVHPPDVLASVTTGAWALIITLKWVMCLFFLIGISGIYARQVEQTGWLGLVGYLMLGLSWWLQTAYVFIDKVTAFASSHRIPVKYLLACVLAHEIGHLLLPANAHRPDGIMRDGWHSALFPPRTPGVLGFPPEQARLLRLRARRQ